MNDLEYVVKQLQDRNIKKVAETVNLSYLTILTIANGKNTSPSFKTLKKLLDYFKGV